MNIFLDSNVFWKDPYLTRGKKAILLRLAKHEDVKLYISETVYQEVLRGHKNFLDAEIKSIGDSFKKITPYLHADRDQYDVNVELENLISDFHDYFLNLGREEQLERIPYDSDVLTEIVEVDAYSKPPFIQKQEIIDKKGEKQTFSKKEIRDAIIWYSYKVFIEKNTLKECYFISNNAKDYGAPGAKNAPKEKPYPLHPLISEEVEITAYKTVHDFLIHKDTEVKELFKDEYLHLKVLSEDFYEQITVELQNGLAEEMVNRFLIDQIYTGTENLLSDKDPVRIHSDYFWGGYVHPESFTGNIENIRFRDVDIYGETIAISVDLEVKMDVQIYLYNPGYDEVDEKYQYVATDTVKVEESLVFLISIDTEKELDIENFSFREYVEGLEPENLNIEIVDITNIHHTSMFGEDEYEYEDGPQNEDTDNKPLLIHVDIGEIDI
ncbi:PIN domain-containing protein [Mesobacillus selenatarsenatis]|uniref:DUF4935 domain-containing protein n=1 Tax=Mesobacillus selenatarsenatis TaxID=388741 RepID=A0A846TQH4_9BACI|nr:PIN domain-containing protein [Mesobacillus selenatarsenatis]NKE04671.1 DUF4935 domain-containing protein [Mesobacillus selenatarsenatis]